MIIVREYVAGILMFFKLAALLLVACGTAYLLRESGIMFLHMLNAMT